MSIQVDHLTKAFNGKTVVRDVSFIVKDGEFVSLLGPSGSGKSTVLRCIAGLERPTAGMIQINDDQVTHVPVQERKIGFVFQHYALFKNMTVLENVCFGLSIRKTDKHKKIAKAREVLSLVGLSGLENRLPSQLSGGQRQRVALARALAPEPSLLLLDEPLSALDSRLRKELRQWLKNLHERIQLTSLMVTHDQDEAFELSDRILVINDGKIEQDARPQDIFDKPATPFVAQFVGESNFAGGIVREGTVAWGPFRFKATHLGDKTSARILFRPNDVYIASRREAGGFPGQIQSVQFLGALVALKIQVDDVEVLAHVPQGVAEQSGFEIKKTVYVMITKSHVFEHKS